MKKRIMSMLCVVSMLMSLCSVNALAVTNTGEMEMTQPTQFLQMEQPDFLSFADAEPMAEQNAGVQTANITDTVTIIPEVFTDFLTEGHGKICPVYAGCRSVGSVNPKLSE